MSGERRRVLVEISQKANRLAKKLVGTNREDAYRVKALACGLLIVEGAATVNGVRSEDMSVWISLTAQHGYTSAFLTCSRRRGE